MERATVPIGGLGLQRPGLEGKGAPTGGRRVPGEEDGNSFEGHSLQFKDSLGKTSLSSVLALETARLRGRSSNAVFWRKNFSAPFKSQMG